MTYKYPYNLPKAIQQNILFMLFMLLSTIGAPFTVLCQTTECVNEGLRTNQCGCDRTDFRPVCGCDGVTYLNNCIAFSCGAVQSYTDGTCEDLFGYIYPTFLTTDNKLTLHIGVKETTFVTITIYDLYGRVYFQRLIPTVDSYFGYKLEFNAEMFPFKGMYYIAIVGGNRQYQVLKFLKQPR